MSNNLIELSNETELAIESFEKMKREKSKFKNPIESIVNTDFTHKLFEAGQREMRSLQKAWKDNGGTGNKPNKLPHSIIAQTLKQHTRFVQLNSGRNDENSPLYVYLEDEGIYSSNRSIIDKYIRIVEWQVSRHDQSEVYNFLSNTAERVEQTKDRYLIPVNNGIFNLKTKQLQSFDPKYVFTSKIDTDYIENAKHPEFEDGWNVDDWLMEIANNDVEIYNLLWEVISDSINGNYSRKISIWLVGDGSNGKGTYQDLIRHVVGTQNVAGLKIDQFAGNSNGQNFNLAMLEGKTVNIGDDVQSNLYIDDSSNFNSVVTGDSVIVEHKGKPGYVVEFTLTIIQSTNGLPRIKNKTDGTYRRFLFVPFEAKFDGEKLNHNIKDVYIRDKKVLEYVLNKSINMDFNEFTIPKVSKEMLEDYKVSNDPVLEFKNEVFDEVMEELKLDRLPKQTAHDMFKQFCKDRSYQSVGFNRFNEQFEKMISAEYESKTIRWIKNDGELSFNIPVDARHPERNKTYKGYIKL